MRTTGHWLTIAAGALALGSILPVFHGAVQLKQGGAFGPAFVESFLWRGLPIALGLGLMTAYWWRPVTRSRTVRDRQRFLAGVRSVLTDCHYRPVEEGPERWTFAPGGVFAWSGNDVTIQFVGETAIASGPWVFVSLRFGMRG